MKCSFSLSLDELFLCAGAFASYEGTCFLYSGGNLDSAQKSFLSLFPYETITCKHQKLIQKKGNTLQISRTHTPWQDIEKNFLAPLFARKKGMAVGWFGYGMSRYGEEDLFLLGRISSLADAYWQKGAVTLCYHHDTNLCFIEIDEEAVGHLGDKEAALVESLSSEKGWRKLIQSFCKNPHFEASVAPSIFPASFLESKESYFKKIAEIHEWIREGEVYQINLSHSFDFPFHGDPFSFFYRLSKSNPAPFSVYFRTHEGTIVSSSPERLLSKTGDRLESRPIKGTMRRGDNLEEDARLKEKLRSSIKERSELLMITDLMRNDLGKISQAGSVKVKELYRLEAYSNVFHLLSVIESKVVSHLSPVEIIQSIFPGGSVTGCPKINAMKYIDVLEQRARGLYTGSIGYFTGKGDFDFNIAIRTVTFQRGKGNVQLGGGIVIDSDPLQEYEETLHKGASIFALL